MFVLSRFIPAWILHYPKRLLAHDCSAGLIFAVLAIPQSLAYALLAGLPPQAGLYVSILPAIVYAWFGSSMVQAVGPVAITAMLTFTTLQPLALPGSALYIQLAAYLALMSGVLLCMASFLRLGFLSQLLSRPVIQGFISGSAMLIVISQFRHLLGLENSDAHHIHALFNTLNTFLSEPLSASAWIGLISLCVLALSRLFLADVLKQMGIKKNAAHFAVRLMPLLVIVITTLLVAYFEFSKNGVKVVGNINEGLPGLSLFLPDSHLIASLLLPAALMALIGMVQNIAIAQALAIKRNEKVDPNSELLGLGSANIVAAFYGGMPVGGGVSRSALNVSAGAQSPLATIFAALFIAMIVASFAASFSYLPIAVLAANIIVAAFSMIDLTSLRNAWHYDRADAVAWMATAVGVIFLGLERGIELGILLSLSTLLIRARSPHIARLGRLAGTEHFRNTDRHDVETLPNVIFLRIDGNLFFGNMNAIESRIARELSEHPHTQDVVLVMSAVSQIDTTAMEMLFDRNRSLNEQGIRLHMAEIKGPVQDRLSRSKLWTALSGTVFLSVNDAFEILKSQQIMMQKSYPIEVEFPSLDRWKNSESGIDYVHTFDSGRAGPHVMLNALTHGNEVCGAIVLDELLQMGLRPVCGKLTLSFANIAAYQSFDAAHPDASRFVDQDLNRVWSADVLDSDIDSSELRRARALRELVDSVDYLLDLHSMHESCAPLLLSGPLEKGIDLAKALGFPAHIVVDKGHSQGQRLRDYAGFGDPNSSKNALLIECGQHWERQSLTVAREMCARFLLHFGLIDTPTLAHWRLAEPQTPMLIHITDAIVAHSLDFRFCADYRGLEVIEKQGSVIGYDGNQPIRTPYDNCILIMPSLRQLACGVTVVRFGNKY